MKKFFVAAFVAAFLTGCASTETQSPAPVEETAPGSTAAAAGGAAGGTAGGATTGGVTTAGISGSPSGGGLSPALKDPRNILSKRIIYFDYDSFAVKDEYRAQVEAHAKYLQTTRVANITLHGHTDERGSREYNIALGQKRSDAVKQLMRVLGATEIQIETVSFGKEKPKSDGHDEAAWAQNRRVEIIYVGE